MRRFPNGGLLLTLVLGALLEPVGHAAAYALRYGPSRAWLLQSSGSHAYFPRVLSFSSMSLAVLLGLGLLAAIAVRLILGTRLVDRTALGPTFAVLAMTQCALFSVKETLEALAIQSSPDLLAIGILALVVQIPLALMAAWVISWLRGYLQLAPEAVRALLAVRLAFGRPPIALRIAFVARRVHPTCDIRAYARRGPPLSI
jgi:hypothetical protein